MPKGLVAPVVWSIRWEEKKGWGADEKDRRRKRKRGSEDCVKEGYHDHFQSRKMSVWLSMLGIFASQHWQIYFITKDAEPKWVNKMSLSMACQSTPRVTNIWLVFSLQIIPVALLRVCFCHISWQIQFFIDVPDAITETWIFILSQSWSTAIVARLWKPEVEISGQGNYFSFAGNIQKCNILLICFTEARLSDTEKNRKE